MARKFFEQVGGVITVKIKDKNVAPLINMAVSRGVNIWNVKKTASGVTFKIRSSAFEALSNIAAEKGYELDTVKKQGLPFYRIIIRRRLGFIIGAGFFLLILYLLSSFVWFIDVTGNHNIASPIITDAARKHGLYLGAMKWGFSGNQVEKDILEDLPELVYIRINIQGVKAHIQVVEKVLPANEITGPCNIVAAQSGIIEEILVFQGEPKVKKGDVVVKGDVLISGLVPPSANPFNLELAEKDTREQLVRARGEVKARIRYEGYGECLIKTEKLVLTGKSINKIYFATPWKNFGLIGTKKPDFALSKQSPSQLSINTPLGKFGFYRVKIEEQNQEILQYDEKEAERIANGKAIKNLSEQIGKEIQPGETKTNIISSPSDPVLRVKVWLESVEDIAVASAIQ